MDPERNHFRICRAILNPLQSLLFRSLLRFPSVPGQMASPPTSPMSDPTLHQINNPDTLHYSESPLVALLIPSLNPPLVPIQNTLPPSIARGFRLTPVSDSTLHQTSSLGPLQVSTKHPRSDRKNQEWSIRVHNPIVFIGDSNLARLPHFQNPLVQVDSFPGANCLHIARILQKNFPLTP